MSAPVAWAYPGALQKLREGADSAYVEHTSLPGTVPLYLHPAETRLDRQAPEASDTAAPSALQDALRAIQTDCEHLTNAERQTIADAIEALEAE